MASTLVLQKSLAKHAGEIDLIIRPIYQEPEYADISSISSLSIGTVFSLQRFLVSSIGNRYNCDMAMYIDSDIVCLNDFLPMLKAFMVSDKKLCVASPNRKFKQPVQSAVLLTRTDKLTQMFFESQITSYAQGNITYSSLMASICNSEHAMHVSHIFNSRDFVEKDTVFLHYTDVWTQPWISPFRSEAKIWMKEHIDLLRSSEEYREVVHEGIQKFFYRPGLLSNRKNLFIADLFFLPPQINVYIERHKWLKWLPRYVVGLMAQSFAFLRATFNIRTT
jgi:hypothetical protein